MHNIKVYKSSENKLKNICRRHGYRNILLVDHRQSVATTSVLAITKTFDKIKHTTIYDDCLDDDGKYVIILNNFDLYSKEHKDMVLQKISRKSNKMILLVKNPDEYIQYAN